MESGCGWRAGADGERVRLPTISWAHPLPSLQSDHTVDTGNANGGNTRRRVTRERETRERKQEPDETEGQETHETERERGMAVSKQVLGEQVQSTFTFHASPTRSPRPRLPTIAWATQL